MSDEMYNSIGDNEDIPFYCFECSSQHTHEIIDELCSSPSINNDSFTSCDFSDAHSSDFEWVTDSDSDIESRGLAFDSLPVPNNHKGKKSKIPIYQLAQGIPLQTRNFKYPCVVCRMPCKTNCQDSICCTICDEWTHFKCSNLTFDQFKKYCAPENSDMPFYCEICLYGSRVNRENENCLKASEIALLDSNDIYNLSPNSIFSEDDNMPTTR